MFCEFEKWGNNILGSKKHIPNTVLLRKMTFLKKYRNISETGQYCLTWRYTPLRGLYRIGGPGYSFDLLSAISTTGRKKLTTSMKVYIQPV